MKKSDKEKGIDIDYDDKILKFIEQKGAVSISELDMNKLAPSRQTLRRNLRKLLKNNLIRSYLKMKPEIGFVVPKEDEIYFTTTNNYEQPQEALRLINEMCGNDKTLSLQAFNDFIDLYIDRIEKNFVVSVSKDESSLATKEWFKNNQERIFKDIMQTAKEDGRRLAYALMCAAFLGLKEKVAFSLTCKNEEGSYTLVNIDNLHGRENGTQFNKSVYPL